MDRALLDSLSLKELVRRARAAKRAVPLANRLGKKHKSRVLGNYNKLRFAILRVLL